MLKATVTAALKAECGSRYACNPCYPPWWCHVQQLLLVTAVAAAALKAACVALCTRTRHPCYPRRGITCTECHRLLLLLLLLLLGGAASRMLLLLLLSQGSV